MKTTGNTFPVTCTNANTEYPLALDGATSLFVQARAADCKVAHHAGDIANGNYMTLKAATPPRKISDLTGPRTLYFASTTAGAVVEVEVWL